MLSLECLAVRLSTGAKKKSAVVHTTSTVTAVDLVGVTQMDPIALISDGIQLIIPNILATSGRQEVTSDQHSEGKQEGTQALVSRRIANFEDLRSP